MTSSVSLIFPVKPGTLSKRDRSRLSRAGVLVIEHEHPEQLFALSVDRLLPDAGVLARCAIDALRPSFGTREDARVAFVAALAAAMKPQEPRP